MTTVSPRPPVAELRAAWQALRISEPNMRARDVAKRLTVSEGELLASRCGDGVTRLRGPWHELVQALPAVGRVMALTRNEYCVHEKKGEFGAVDTGPVMGIVLNHDIDLRLFFRHWQHGFATTEHSGERVLRSLQFFDGDGTAVHKVYMTEGTDAAAWNALIHRFTAPVQSPLLDVVEVAPPLSEERLDSQIDVDALRADWRAMRDPHDFFALLKRHRTVRTQALRLVGNAFARQVRVGAIEDVLTAAAASALPLMVFVGSPGVVQIHSGPVHVVKRMGPWLNVLDDDFNLHLRDDHVVEAWIVSKPSPDGSVTSLELYDAGGHQVVQVFGLRKPGIPERADWRALLATVADHA